ncbi:MAG: hypothetical protein KGJ13_08735 [Patescibacteria group bacterium]|nr:hypothetical protein [Patescibacteria group bacterium]
MGGISNGSNSPVAGGAAGPSSAEASTGTISGPVINLGGVNSPGKPNNTVYYVLGGVILLSAVILAFGRK